MLILTFLFSLATADCGGELAQAFLTRAHRINPALDASGNSLEEFYLRLKREGERPQPMDAPLRQHLEENFGRHFVIGEDEEATRFYRNSLWNLRAAVARRWLADNAGPIATEHRLDPKFVTRMLDSFFEPAGYLVSLEGPGLLADDVEKTFRARPWADYPWADVARALTHASGIVSQAVKANDPELAARLGAHELRRLDRAQMETRHRLTRDGHTCCQNHEQRCQICPLNYYWHKDAKNRVHPSN